MGRDNCGTSGAVRGEMVLSLLEYVCSVYTPSIHDQFYNIVGKGWGWGLGAGDWRDYQVFQPTTRAGQCYFGV